MNKKILFISIFILIVLSIATVSAQDADDAIASSESDVSLGDSQTTISGSVSGGVDVATKNPGTSSGELSYDIPADAKTIKSADVYVNVYSGSAQNTHGANANITIKTVNENKTYNEELWIQEGTTDGTVYTVNNHTTKCYSDYMIHYDITSLLTGLNGTKLTIKADTFNMTEKQFDGRIKLIALVLAYDDGDDDSISYFINSDQLWSKSNATITFDTSSLTNVFTATLTNIVLSSGDGTYRINDGLIGDADTHNTGNGFYYQYNKWNDLSDFVKANQKTAFNVAYAGTSTYGSIKNVLSVLAIDTLKINSSASIKTEYTSVPSIYAGTNNTLTVTVNTDKAGKYTIRLLADGVKVDEVETDIDGTQTLKLTDPTIRDVDETTVNGADNKNATYTVEILYNNKLINSSSIIVPVLYNGYLGKDLAYPASGMESLDTIIINGDIVFDVKTDYLSSQTIFNKTDVWNINLDENSTIVKAFVYVPYTWCTSSEGLNMFNTTFNGNNVTAIALYRDQSNLGGSGKNGYGVLVYDVTSLINKTGNNTLFVSKSARYPSLYSSALVYMYNTTNSNYIKEIYINHGADLLYNNYNEANRVIKSDSTFAVNPKVVSNATLYVFASNAQNNAADLVFNGETTKNIFVNGQSYVTSCYELDVTGKVKESNSVSVIGAGKTTFLVLQQIMVLTKNIDDVEITLAPEYTSVPSAYAGTVNAITITVEALKAGKFNATLFADGVEVNKTEVDLAVGTNKFVLTDPTIRAVDASTVNGADNKKVNYTLQISGKNATISIPILYNGNLGKDLAYPAGGMESFLNITINGDIVIDVKDVSSYLGAGVMNRTDVWNVNLDAKSSIVKSFVYVPYNWFNAKTYTEDETMFNVTFNDASIVPVAFIRDQSNLGNYGKYGYGVLVYDVTNLIKSGENSFVLNKKNATPAVYPSVLIYMYNTTGSAVIKNVYISNGADLLAGTSNNVAKRPVHADSTIDVKTADTAKLFIFAASAQSGEGNIVFNGNVYENVWSGTGSSTDLYTLDITDSVKNSNNISFVATGSTILALQQIIVTTQKAPTTITAPAVTITYNTNNKNLIVTLKDSNGNAVANAKLSINFNGKTTEVNTNTNGQATLAIKSTLVPKTYTATITYAGDDTHIKSTAKTTVKINKASVKLTAKKKTFKAKVKTKKYTVTLKNNKGKVMKKVKLTLKVKGKTFKATTNSKGKATFKITNLKKKANIKAKLTYKGDKYFKKVTKTVNIKVKK